MEILQKVQKLKAELDSLRPFDPEREARIWQKLRLDWNYHSNKLEGNSYSYGETKMLLMKGLTAGGKPVRDHEEITGHNEAISFVLDSIRDDEPLTEMFIRHLHTLTLVRDFWSEAKTVEGLPTKRMIRVGVYKTEPNHVETQSGDIFRFAEPIEAPAMMEELVRWYREKEESEGANPVLLATEFHYRFVRIHPFGDGNGRVARLLMNFILMKHGYPPVIVKSDDKDSYLAVLEQADFTILEPFVDYIATNLCISLGIMIRGAKGENIEEPDDLDKEIALLEREIRGIGKRVSVTKSREAILSAFEESIAPLARSFFTGFTPFRRVFVENRAFIVINGKLMEGEFDDAITYARKEFKKHPEPPIDHIELKYLVNEFNQDGLGQFQYTAGFRIQLGLTKFTVEVIDFGAMHSLLYTETLHLDEIERLVAEQKRKLSEIIKTRIKEASN